MIIYKATNKKNGKVYIGQTTIPILTRKYQHGFYAKYKNNNYFANTLKKNGVDSFEWEEIDSADSIEELDYLEKFWIKFYRSNDRKYGYNSKEGGGHGKHSLESKNKMSKSQKGKWVGEKNGFYGKNHTEKTKRHLSDFRKNLYASGYVHPSLGLHHSEDAKLKMSKNSVNKKPIRQIDIITNETIKIWDSATEASKALNKNNSCGISANLRKKTKTAYGFKWEYV